MQQNYARIAQLFHELEARKKERVTSCAAVLKLGGVQVMPKVQLRECGYFRYLDEENDTATAACMRSFTGHQPTNPLLQPIMSEGAPEGRAEPQELLLAVG